MAEYHVTDDIQWQLLGLSVDYVILSWASGDYPEVTFSLVMERTGATITVTVIAPGVAVSLLGLLYIFMPKGGGERVPYLATIILTEIMFLVMLT